MKCVVRFRGCLKGLEKGYVWIDGEMFVYSTSIENARTAAIKLLKKNKIMKPEILSCFEHFFTG